MDCQGYEQVGDRGDRGDSELRGRGLVGITRAWALNCEAVLMDDALASVLIINAPNKHHVLRVTVPLDSSCG